MHVGCPSHVSWCCTVQAEAAREWDAIASSAGGALAPEEGHPADEFLNAASKLQVRQDHIDPGTTIWLYLEHLQPCTCGKCTS